MKLVGKRLDSIIGKYHEINGERLWAIYGYGGDNNALVVWIDKQENPKYKAGVWVNSKDTITKCYSPFEKVKISIG